MVNVSIVPHGFPAGVLQASVTHTMPNGTKMTYTGTSTGIWTYPVTVAAAGTHTFKGGIIAGTKTAITTSANIAVGKVDTFIRFATTSGFFVGNNIALSGIVEKAPHVYVGVPTYAIVSGTAATVSGSNLIPISSGVVTVRASYAGNATQYNAAVSVDQLVYLYVTGDSLPDLQVISNTAYILSENQTPTSLYGTDLGWVEITDAGTSVPVTFTVKNNGAAPLIISGTQTSGSTLASDLGSTTLTTGQMAQMTMTYMPTRVKSEQPFVEIASNDPNKPLFRVPIKAKTFYQIPSSDLPISSLHGATDIADAASGQVTTIKIRQTNTGIGNLRILGMSSDNPVFTLGGIVMTDTHGATSTVTIPATVEPGCFVEFTVNFTPTTSGYQTAIISTLTNDPTYPTYKVPVAANGL